MKKCPLCSSDELLELYKKNNTYTSIGKISNNKNANVVKSDIKLVQCQDCGYIFNSKFDEEKINSEYKSNEYVLKKIVSHKMSENLHKIKDYLLQFLTKESIYLEIGCGDGALALEIAPFVKHVYTIDPSVESININSVDNLTHVNNFYSEKILKELNIKPNVIVARHLLEHISEPYKFLQTISNSLENNAYLYIEVPNMDEIIRHHRFYDIFNDHFGYFTKETLKTILANFNMELINENMLFNEQHMGLTFQKRDILVNKKSIKKLYNNIQEDFNKAILNLNSKIYEFSKIAIYGAGAHGNCILDYIEDKSKIVCCFDKDSKKQGKYLQGTSIEIKAPSKENLNKVEAIVIASSLYEDEIEKGLLEAGFKNTIIKTAIM